MSKISRDIVAAHLSGFIAGALERHTAIEIHNLEKLAGKIELLAKQMGLEPADIIMRPALQVPEKTRAAKTVELVFEVKGARYNVNVDNRAVTQL